MYIHAKPASSSVSRYDTLKQVEKSTGKTPKELEAAPALSGEHSDAWQAYTSLTEYTYGEIDSYIRLTGHQLSGWEVKAIMGLAKYRGVEPIWPLK